MGDIEIHKCDFCKETKQVQRTYLKPSLFIKPTNPDEYLKLYNEGDYFLIVYTCSDCGQPIDKDSQLDALKRVNQIEVEANNRLRFEHQKLQLENAILQSKADKWNKLESAIAKEYDNEESDLCIIGEIAANHLGYL